MAFAAMASWHKVPWKENGLSRVLHNVNFVTFVLCKNVTQSFTFSRLIFCEILSPHESTVVLLAVSYFRTRVDKTRTLHLHSGLFGGSQTAPIGLYCWQTASTEWSVLTMEVR